MRLFVEGSLTSFFFLVSILFCTDILWFSKSLVMPSIRRPPTFSRFFLGFLQLDRLFAYAPPKLSPHFFTGMHPWREFPPHAICPYWGLPPPPRRIVRFTFASPTRPVWKPGLFFFCGNRTLFLQFFRSCHTPVWAPPFWFSFYIFILLRPLKGNFPPFRLGTFIVNAGVDPNQVFFPCWWDIALYS